jgi:cell division septation protein DedD
MSDGKEMKEKNGPEQDPDSDKAVPVSAPDGEEGAPSATADEDAPGLQSDQEASATEVDSQVQDNAAVSTAQSDESDAAVQSSEPQESAEAEADSAEAVAEKDSAQEAGEPRSDEVSLAAMRLVEVDGAEGIRDAKKALGELEALLDEFEKPSDPESHSEGRGGDDSDRITQSQLDSRLEGVAAAVAAAASSNSASASSMGNGQGKARVIVGVIGVLALVLSLVVLLQQSGIGDRVEVLEQAGGAVSSGGASDVARLRMEFRQLAEKVNELTVMMDGTEGLSGSSDETVAAIETRLARLERQLAAAPDEAEVTAQEQEAPEQSAAPVATAPTGGRWVINLTSFAREQVADQEIKRLRDAGVQVEKQRAVSSGKVWYRLRITGLATYEKAKAYIAELDKVTDTGSAWISGE